MIFAWRSQLTEFHSDKSKLRESLQPDAGGGSNAGSGSGNGVGDPSGGDVRVRGGGGVSPGPDNVDRQMAYLATQSQSQV